MNLDWVVIRDMGMSDQRETAYGEVHFVFEDDIVTTHSITHTVKI